MWSGRCFLVALMLFVVGCGSTGSPEPASVVDAEPEAPPPPYHVYVTNEGGGDLTVIAGESHDVLATIPLAVIARQTRSAMLEVLSEDYVRTARSKGLAPVRVIGLHALRNALIPVVTTIGLQVGVLLAGAILTETIFSWPGIGKWMVDSVFKRDYSVVQGGLLLIAGMIMLVNLVVDLVYGLINPRIRR